MYPSNPLTMAYERSEVKLVFLTHRLDPNIYKLMKDKYT